jgi:hypothetical protein
MEVVAAREVVVVAEWGQEASTAGVEVVRAVPAVERAQSAAVDNSEEAAASRAAVRAVADVAEMTVPA